MTAREWRDWSCKVRVVVGQDDTTPDDVADDAAVMVGRLMDDVARAASRFRHDSELERVNDAAPRLLPVGPLALQLVETALDAARRTDGAVDPTIGRHLVAWGYDADIDEVRAAPDRRGRVLDDPAPADWRHVVVDRTLGRVGVARGHRLDLGATAKAWTADEAARRVAAKHRRPAMVEIGGDVAVAGGSDAPWHVRVAEVADGPGQVIALVYGGLATSSTVARRWSTASGPAHHIIDPSSGVPAEGPIRTASVWAPSCTLANAYSTAALVWGAAAQAYLELASISARLVDQAGTVLRTSGWPAEESAA
ncbi:FAD:protein FMN transferase [Nocardioides sp. AN3]